MGPCLLNNCPQGDHAFTENTASGGVLNYWLALGLAIEAFPQIPQM